MKIRPIGKSATRRRDRPEAERLRELRLRIALALGILFAMLGAGLALDRSHSPVHSELLAAVPSASATTLLSGIATPAHGGNAPAIEADLRNFRLEEIESPPPTPASGPGGDFLVELPVAWRDCTRLEAELGGSCGGGSGTPLRNADIFAIESDSLLRPLTAEILPDDAGVLALSQFGDPARESLPSDWSLKQDASHTVVDFRCWEKATLTITVVLRPVPVGCTPHEATFQLLIAHEKPYLQSVFLNDLSKLVVTMSAKHVRTAVDDGKLLMAGEETPLRGGRSELISIRSAGDRPVEVNLDEAIETEEATLTVEAKSGRALVDGESMLPSRLDRHSGFWFLSLGLALGLILSALVDYVAVRYR